MPIDHGTIVGETNIDRLTTILADENQNFFIDTYSFYLVALVLSGKSIFYGRGRFVNIFFVKSRNYAFPGAPSENAPEEEKKKYRHEAGKKLDRIRNILYSDRIKEYDSDKFDFDELDTNNPYIPDGDFYDIVSTLGLAARIAVTSFLCGILDLDKRLQFIQNRRDEKVSIRKTLQIMFWNEIRRCFEQKHFAFKKKGNGYYIYIPSASLRTDPDELLENVNEKGEIELPEQKSAFCEVFKEGEKPSCVYDDEQNEKERFQRDSWDIRRYRIFLVKQVGNKLSFQLKHLSPMKCYALYYGLCDRKPFLNLIQDQKIRLHYEGSKDWSDQMIANLFALDSSIPEGERKRISRENVKNYRQSYARELEKWLCDKVPDLEKYVAHDLVSANDIRFEQIAIPFFRTHLPDMTKEKLIGMSEEDRVEYLHNAYADFVNKEKTLKL